MCIKIMKSLPSLFILWVSTVLTLCCDFFFCASSSSVYPGYYVIYGKRNVVLFKGERIMSMALAVGALWCRSALCFNFKLSLLASSECILILTFVLFSPWWWVHYDLWHRLVLWMMSCLVHYDLFNMIWFFVFSSGSSFTYVSVFYSDFLPWQWDFKCLGILVYPMVLLFRKLIDWRVNIEWRFYLSRCTGTCKNITGKDG